MQHLASRRWKRQGAPREGLQVVLQVAPRTVVAPPWAVTVALRVTVLAVPLGAWQSQQEIRKPQLLAALMVPGVLAGLSVFHGGFILAFET